MAMTKCKECGHSISTKAEACPSCGAKQVRTSGCAKVVLTFFIVMLAFALLGQCMESTTPTRSTSSSSSPAPKAKTPVSAPIPVSAPEPGSQWRYSQREDPMTSAKIYYASVRSSNTVNFDFPYSGPQRGTLTLRTHPRYGRDLIFNIERGQVLCRSYDGCTVLVRFDDKEAQRFSAAGAADNSTESLFLQNYSRFAGEMLKADRVRISVPIYQQGTPVFEFDVSGFQTEKYRPSE